MNDNDIFSSMQILDLKHLAEIEHQWKTRCYQAILSYKGWSRQNKTQKDALLRYYGALEGDLLRTNACNFIRAYWQIRTDCRRVFAQYRAEQCVFVPYDAQKYKRIANS